MAGFQSKRKAAAAKREEHAMNERIKELAHQADPDYTGEYDDDMGHALVGNEAIQKFAELIVRECAESLWTEECYNSDLALEEFEKNSKKIKQHFGVEE
ncbi:hypothetical protein EBT31_09810 [bacterium]|nr:hypothetical protein [bacterium]